MLRVRKKKVRCTTTRINSKATREKADALVSKYNKDGRQQTSEESNGSLASREKKKGQTQIDMATTSN